MHENEHKRGSSLRTHILCPDGNVGVAGLSEGSLDDRGSGCSLLYPVNKPGENQVLAVQVICTEKDAALM